MHAAIVAKMRVERWTEGERVDARELRRRMEADGYGVFEWSDPPGRTYAPHAHGEDQSHWIVSGALALTVDGREYVLEAGDRDFLPAGTVHAARVVGDEPVVYLIGARR
jgi:quercetin dioxygenase-like cupin family protein